MKRNPTKYNIFEIEPYRSILNLLIEFQRNKGLRQSHFRYALIKNHDIDNLHKYTIIEMEKFYGGNLDFLIDNGYIKTNCVTSRNNLTNFLSKLQKLKAIRKVKSGNKIFYRMNEDYYLQATAVRNKEFIERYSFNEILPVEERNYRCIIYGFKKRHFDNLPQYKKDELNAHIRSIENYLQEIIKIKHNIEFDEMIRRMASIIDKSGKTDLFFNKVLQIIMNIFYELIENFHLTKNSFDELSEFDESGVLKKKLMKFLSYDDSGALPTDEIAENILLFIFRLDKKDAEELTDLMLDYTIETCCEWIGYRTTDIVFSRYPKIDTKGDDFVEKGHPIYKSYEDLIKKLNL